MRFNTRAELETCYIDSPVWPTISRSCRLLLSSFFSEACHSFPFYIMDDLLDLNWAGDSNKNKPPSIPQKPSYLAGNPTSTNSKKQDAFADLLNLPSSQKPTDRSQLPLAEQQRLMRQEAMGIQSPASFTSVPSSTKSSPRQQPQDTFGSLLDPFGGKSSNTTSNANTPLNAL